MADGINTFDDASIALVVEATRITLGIGDRRNVGGRIKPPTSIADKFRQVTIAGNESGGEKYNGFIVTAPSTVSMSGDLSVAELGGTDTSTPCYIINAGGQGQGGSHDLDEGTNWPGILWSVAPDGKPVVLINASQAEDCTPDDDEDG